MVNASELLINVVTMIEPTAVIGSGQNGMWSCCLALESGHVGHCTTGGQAGPSLFTSSVWNRVSPNFRPRGRRTARNADGSEGKGGRRKRMPSCNGADRGWNITPRETGQTSDWSLLARGPKYPHRTTMHDQNAGALLRPGVSCFGSPCQPDGELALPIRGAFANPSSKMEDSEMNATRTVDASVSSGEQSSPFRDVACHGLGEGDADRQGSSGTYREGGKGREMAQGSRPATAPDPLALGQVAGRASSDREQGQEDTRCRSGTLVHA